MASRDNPKPKKKDPWLHAWYDPVAGLNAHSACARLADLSGDGDAKLLVADADRKLKVFKGTALCSEHLLLDVPVAMCAFYSDRAEPRTPSVAVAAGPFVFIYRNLRPYYKVKLPHIDIAEEEAAVWAELRTDAIAAPAAVSRLGALRDGGVSLSSRSLDILALDEAGAEKQSAFVARHKQAPLVQQTVTTCLEKLNKDTEAADGVAYLVVGTESRLVLVLSPGGSDVLVRIQLPSPPVHMAVTGMYDVDYRIVVACRDGALYTIKNGKLSGSSIGLEAQACALLRLDKSILVGCMGNTLHCFSIKGRKQFSLFMPAPITELCAMHVERAHTIKAFLVSLLDGDVRLYSWNATGERSRELCRFRADSSVVAMRFGRFGREDNALILLHRNGALTIKMLQRLAQLDAADVPAGPPPEQDVPINVPKKTRLYVEQTQREREKSIEMHRIFQQDLCKLRVSTARAYAKILADGTAGGAGGVGTSVASHAGAANELNLASLRLNARVLGLGPRFKIKLEVQNAGSQALANVPLVCKYDEALYRLPCALHRIPLLIPGLQYQHEIDVEAVGSSGRADVIRVLVCNPSSCTPLISALVSMPLMDAIIQ